MIKGWVALAAALVTLVTACTGGPGPHAATPTTGAKSAATPSGWRESAPADRGSASVSGHGWTVALNGPGPAGSTLTINAPSGQQTAATTALAALTRLGVTGGEPMQAELHGGALPAGGATLTRQLDVAVPEGQGRTVAYYDPAHDAWTTVASTLSADRHILRATVSHFTLFTDIGDGLAYGIGWALDTRVPAPTCAGNVPSWAPRGDITYLDDKNAPVRWCVGSDPKDSSLLVVKATVNRGYGVTLIPSTSPAWTWDSLFQGGPEDVLVRVLDGALRLPDRYGQGHLLVPPGAEADMAFTEAAVRRAGGNPLVKVDDTTLDMVAGLTYTAITKFVPDEGPAAALVALLGVAQCGTTFTGAVVDHQLAEAAHAALLCLTTHADDIARDLALALAALHPDRDAKALGVEAGHVGGRLWQVWAAGLAFGVGTWFADRGLNGATWTLNVFPKTIRPTVPAVSLAAFTGDWLGHTRHLAISAAGLGHESVGDGCCTPQIDLTFQLTNPRGTGPTNATATATVIAVHIYPGWYGAAQAAPPQVGQQSTVTIVGGLLTDHLDGVDYCTTTEDLKGTCGA